MKYSKIRCFPEINAVNTGRVDQLVKDMLENGWQGAPILVYGESLLTGSHRQAALKEIDRMVNDGEIDDAVVLHQDVAEDVTDIVEGKMAEAFEEDGEYPEIEYSNIGWLLTGSWVEEYKDQIVEWGNGKR